MKEKNRHSPSTWVDPDDAPEITSELLSSGTAMIGDRVVSKSDFDRAVKKNSVGRPPLKNPKLLVSIRYDPEIIKYFKATGKGWQSRMNKVLAEYIASH